ncbi:nitrite reductase small subunit NirD [Undibacterium sp.]|uniref:nitrite reductase small subunit NirD n=1 Tax=Undibacterium sp. TaxID=1914977 RepID=UPI00374C8F3C
MKNEIQQDAWTQVCALDDIVPNTGVCALVKEQQIAIFHLNDGGTRLFAVDNYDPSAQASVLSRGLIGSLGERIVVASPIYKNHFDLMTGECLEMPEHSINAYPVRVTDGKVWLGA